MTTEELRLNCLVQAVIFCASENRRGSSSWDDTNLLALAKDMADFVLGPRPESPAIAA